MASVISSSSCLLRSSVVKEKDYTFCPSPKTTRHFLIAPGPGHTSLFSKQPSLSLSLSFNRVFSSSDESESESETTTTTAPSVFECVEWEKDSGIVGIYGEPEAFLLCQRALSSLQHRGQDGAGITVFHNNALQSITGLGLLHDVFKDPIAPPPGTSAIGHVHYMFSSMQPCNSGYRGAIAYTGKIFNHCALRKRLESLGCIFTTFSDVEVVLHLMDISKSSPCPSSIEERLIRSCEELEGAYSMVILTEGKLVAVRDPLGFRPLVMGRRSNGAVVFASETNALDVIEAHYERREVNPGEALVVDADADGMIRSLSLLRDQSPPKSKVCIFEHIYSSLPSSIISGRSVSAFRHALGEILATENPVDCDVVIAVTESGAIPAQGYASKACIPLLHDVLLEKLGPTFNDPPSKIDSDLTSLTPLHSPAKLKAGLKGKRVVVVDDSLVRAVESSKIFRFLKEAGAEQVHMRIACPPVNGFCYYGMKLPHKLNPTILESRGYDSVAFLSLDKLREFLGEEAAASFCYGCFSGNYPLPPPKEERTAAEQWCSPEF